MTKDTIKNLVTRAIDLHVHIGPEIIPRKFNSVAELIQSERGKIGGMALKNHFYQTQPLISSTKNSSNLKLIGSLVLNNFQGGLNPEAIYSNSLLSNLPTIVWFPTVSAKQFLDESEFEIPNEWVQKKDFKTRKTNCIKPVMIDNKVDAVLNAILERNAILATGHISWQEAKLVITKAAKKGIKRLIVTHPIYQRINFPIKEQLKLAKLGAKIEHCYSMYSIDKIPISKIAMQIKVIGAENCIISSDVGQTFSPPPNEALAMFAKLLLDKGITKKELEIMMIKNTNDLINIKMLQSK